MKKLLAMLMALVLTLAGMSAAIAEEGDSWKLSVQVTDVDGRLIEGAQLAVSNAAGEEVYTGNTDAEGKLETSLPAGVYSVRAQDAETGYCAREALDLQADAALELVVRTLVEGSSVTVGSLTKVSGHFSTDMFGNNTSDVDVRAMLHGYSTVAYTDDASYALDSSVVEAEVSAQSDGGKTYTFHLKDGLTYNDGTPITAKDYVFSVLLQSTPQMAEIGGATSAYWQIEGFEDFNGGAQKFAGVRLLDEDSFSLTIRADALPYYYELTYVNVTPYPIGAIAPECSVADDGDGAYIQGEFDAGMLEKTMLDPEHGYSNHPAVTSGPYQLDSYDAETGKVVMTANPRYRGNYAGQRPLIETVTLVPTTNADALDQLADGTLDIVNKISDSEVIAKGMAMRGERGVQASNYLRSGLGFLSFACEQGPTQWQDVRQAVSYCLDQEALVTAFTGMYGRPVYSWYGLGQWMAVDYVNGADGELNAYAVDLDVAAELLERAGFALNERGEAFKAGEDAVRYRLLDAEEAQDFASVENAVVETVEIDGKTYLPLKLRIAKVENNRVCALVEEMLVPNLTSVGFDVEMVPVTFSDEMAQYYREAPRACNVYALATNFTFVFDPLYTWSGEAQHQGYQNTTGLSSETLVALAEALRSTEPGSDQTYLERWQALMAQFNEELPAIPLYSNTYFDFYSERVSNYAVNAHWSWSSAILNAWTEAA